MEITKSVDIAAFVANPAATVRAAQDAPVAVLHRGKPTCYLVSTAQWEAITEAQQDAELAQLACARLIDLKQPVRITLAEL
ncbi:type II toxin-antitoxin system Phd/YefM family antitoxin [Chitinimonas sp. JJ19]|uniref:type II toxin-antitoxin system Phd/YefM family antitoxin n=1 Tax=Chitinimonas sp. JJ19 TaxID=3109352 RepID=UPI001A4B96B3|nr:type II toxin-antitoxin system Phd/YefM family antitoxin [Chitinimonas sp.]